jgi:zinc/manganese transport system ATP-binding protein
MLARELVGWGATAAVLSDTNMARAQQLAASWDEHAPFCARDAGAA